MYLRQDLHFLFDFTKFIITPKWSKWVIHSLFPSEELCKLYHNTELWDIEKVAVEFLFTRFAWAIIPLAKGFVLSPGSDRTVLVRSPTGVLEEVTRPGSELKTMFFSPPSRSKSPTKRRRPTDEETGSSTTQFHMAGQKRRRYDVDVEDASEMSEVSDQEESRNSDEGSMEALYDALLPPINGATTNMRRSDTAPVSASEAVQENQRITSLVEAALERERGRSDPNNTWQVEEEWAATAWDRPLITKDRIRLLRALGMEILDEESWI